MKLGFCDPQEKQKPQVELIQMKRSEIGRDTSQSGLDFKSNPD